MNPRHHLFFMIVSLACASAGLTCCDKVQPQDGKGPASLAPVASGDVSEEVRFVIKNDSINCTLMVFYSGNPIAVMGWSDQILIRDVDLRPKENIFKFRAVYHGNDGMMGWGKIRVSFNSIDNKTSNVLFDKSDDLEEGELIWEWQLEGSERNNRSVETDFDPLESFTLEDRNQVLAVLDRYTNSLMGPDAPRDWVHVVETLDGVPELKDFAGNGFQQVERIPEVDFVVGSHYAMVIMPTANATKEDMWVVKAFRGESANTKLPDDKVSVVYGDKYLVFGKKNGKWGLLRGKH